MRPDERPGYTLIELLAAVAVIGSLLALTIPAAQSSREAARKIACANHLRQVGLALNAYVGLHGCYPAINSISGFGAPANIPYSVHYYSPSARMLMELEQSPLYHSINFTWGPSNGVALSANRTAMFTRVDVFLCPSDDDTVVDGYGRNSYRYNVGPSPWYLAIDSRPDTTSGPFTAHHFYRPADFRDGLSQTVGASERIQGDWTKDLRGPGDYALTHFGDSGKRADADWAVSACASADPAETLESRAGESWFLSGYHFSNYNHCLPPNSPVRDCSLDGAPEGIHERAMHEGVISARSYHPGGVNTLNMDGSLRFIKDTIRLEAWRGLATRSGGEVATDPTP